MSENDPQEVARQALDNQPEDDGNGLPPAAGTSNPLPIVIGVGILALALIGAGLFMLFGSDRTTATAPANGGSEANSLAEQSNEEVAVISTADLAALPEGYSPRGDVAVLVDGNAVAVSGGVQATDDLYLWNGSQWVFVPSMVSPDGQELLFPGQPNGQEVVVISRPAPETPTVGAELTAEVGIPVELLPELNAISVGGIRIGDNGQLEGAPYAMPPGGYRQFLHVTNAGVIVNQTAVGAVLADEVSRASHIQELVTAVQSGNFAGLNLDYQGVTAAQRETFTQFVTDLSEALDVQGLDLLVTLATPASNNGQWDTGGHDWAAIGAAADGVIAQMPLDPTAYADGGVAERLLSWAARQIDRAKLTALFSANAIDNFGSTMRETPLTEVLAKVADLKMDGSSDVVEPGAPVEFSLAGSATPLEWDGESLTYKYTYEEDGQMRTVWLNSDAALAHRLRLAERYGLNGIMVRGLDTVSNPNGYASALTSYTADVDAPQPAGAAITWSILNEEGGVVASSSGESLSYAWDGTETPGNYTVAAGFAQGDLNIELSSIELVVGEAPPTVVADEDTAAEETAEAEEVAEESNTEVVVSGSANAEIIQPSNIRNGPGLIYGIVDGLNPGSKVEVVGRSSDSLWFNIAYPEDKNGWIYGQLIELDSAIEVAGLPVPRVTAAPAAAAPAASGGGASGGGAAAAPAAPAPVAAANLGGGFELGGQLLGGGYAQASYANMTWIKRQHKWSPGNTGQEVAGMISEAHNAGFKILLSIPGQLYPSSLPDFNAYANFLKNVASLPDPPDAIEIWNEMNIEVEWPNGQIDPNMYTTQMLAPAYNAIKSVNPNIMVISGAPAPTGFFSGGCSASGCDDDAYMRGMAAAGAANYMDCIGVHYNEGIVGPNQRSGDPRGSSSHYTRYFWGMLDTYYNAFGGSRPICFTELGYLTPEGYGSLSSGFSWAANTTVSQQAQWLAEAASLSANSGKVRLMIVWNVDSTTYGTDPQAGFAIIRPDGSCPACESLRQVMGG